MQIENVAGVSLASRGTADQQRQGTVSHSVLGKVIVDDEDVLALLHEVFAHGAAGVGGDILQGRQLRCGSGHHDGVAHGTGFGQALHKVCHGRALLTDGNVNADDVLALLVDDGIGGDGGLAGLAVADDQLALTAANGDHGVDGLDAGLQRLLDRLAVDDAGSTALNGAVLGGLDGACTVDGLAQCVDDTADQCVAHRHGNDLAGALDGAAFLDADVGAQQNDGDGVLLQILCHSVFAVVKLQQLTCHALFQTTGPGDAVAHHNDRAGLALLDGIFVMLDLRTDDLGDLFRFQLHLCLFTTQFIIVISGGNSFCALPRLQRAGEKLQSDRRNIPAQGGKTVPDGAVQFGAFDIQPDTAQHLGIHLGFKVDGLAGQAFQLGVQRRALLLGQRNSRDGRSFQNAVRLIVADAVGPCAAGQLPQGALLAQDL